MNYSIYSMVSKSYRSIIRYFSLIFILTLLADSQIINGIAIKVNNIPITTYDIQIAQTKFGISRKDVIPILIREALENAEAEKLNIDVSENEIDRYILNIMNQNRIPSKQAFFQALQYQGIKKAVFIKNIQNQILQSKLYQKVASSKMIPPTRKELLTIYKNSLSKYRVAKSYNVTIYLSDNMSALKEKKARPLLFYRNIKTERRDLISKSINPQVRQILSETKVGYFSEISKFDDSFALFYLNSVEGQTQLSFDEVKNDIENNLLVSQQRKIIETHFKRVLSEAVIENLR